MMSRVKPRPVTEICGDCGASDPSWASINRGILLCAECCSVHRSLGRHISQVKSLRQGSWSHSLLAMVHALGAHGVNSIWEHLLMDPSSAKHLRRKPQPKDPLIPTKTEFIKAKHQQLAFIFRPEHDDSQCIENDLSKQLHASVRSANLETSVRLLVQGADPNYFNDEKGSTPLHVAARAGQTSQVELLVVYGADPCGIDMHGQTPMEVAMAAGHHSIAQRLVECSYEATDRLTYFLCKRKPDHTKGHHYIGPETLINMELSDTAKSARGRLQMLPNSLFEELVMDLYDEVDRRENEAIWQTSSFNPEGCSVPFLPVNPQLSATRNQGRQKLARFSPRELAALIFDTLIDARRRQHVASLQPIGLETFGFRNGQNSSTSSQVPRVSQLSDDEPLYDSVASDDDYAALTPLNVPGQERLQQPSIKPVTINANSSSISLHGSPAHASLSPPSYGSQPLSIEEGECLRQQLYQAMSKITELNYEVQRLTTENCELKSRASNISAEPYSLNSNLSDHFNVSGVLSLDSSTGNGRGLENEQPETEPVHDIRTTPKPSQRPASMYETREGFRNTSFQAQKNQIQREEVRPSMTQSMYQYNNGAPMGLPLPEEVIRRTDFVTKRIQEIWSCMQVPDKRDAFVPCAERIRVAVAELAAIFPQNIADDQIRTALRQLHGNTGRLQAECAGLQRAEGSIDMYLQQVRSSAFEIAKATKQLVTMFQDNPT